ncbi:unnamed protein product [Tuber melanosporum]|uniref:non-specific serine/threonine protein kinase n=1 Tax=Tuber melanosporum (strain Mel28) TaxID=656061 RepID=D5GQ28_TUBMM|nr:uncharacterized protein GSTUM_00012173001 [Tuber melanosporum]CAZ86621.1 unnamed protein product [Tuber melanosporum]
MESRGKGDRTSYRGSRRPLQDTPVNVAYSSSTRAPAPPNYSKPRAFDNQEQQKTTQQTSNRSYKQADSYEPHGTGEYVGDTSSSPVDPPPSTPPPQKPNAHRARVKAQVGPWLLGRTLGKGSSGRVRLAKHVETGQFAAIKIVGKGNDEMVGENGQERPLPPGLEREVVIMKLICHPNVMGLWDVWENRGELYLVLEYIEGGELFDYLTRRGRLPEPEALMYFRQILSGIDYCQHFNICHRDLKPENLLLDSNGNIKIADFGMAALQPHGSLLDTPCGSPHYASPEIVSGKHYDGAKSDIWSCGIILFALLAGYLPFDDDNIRKLLQKVMKGRFVMPVEFSIEAQDLITRMLTIDPEERISMEEIWKHPLVRMYAPLDPVTGEEADRGPKPPRSKDIGRPVKHGRDIDGEILKNLQTLWQGVEENALIERLLNNV